MSELTWDDILEMELSLMDLIMVQKIEDGFSVFSEVENGLLN